MTKKRAFKRPKWFDNNIPDSFQHQVQADLALYTDEKLLKDLKKLLL